VLIRGASIILSPGLRAAHDFLLQTWSAIKSVTRI